jgi:cholesterol oxidase
MKGVSRGTLLKRRSTSHVSEVTAIANEFGNSAKIIVPRSWLGRRVIPFLHSEYISKHARERTPDELNLDARLSITDVSKDLFVIDDNDNTRRPIIHPTIDKVQKFSKEANVCQREGRCGLRCIPDSRHSLEKKIYAAINMGKPLEIYPLCEVDSIEENQDAYYKYRINFTDRRENKDGTKSMVEAKLVVLAAGTLGSTEILLRSKNSFKGFGKLGTHFSTNGDLFGVINPTKESIDATRGPQITSIVRYRDNSTVSAPDKIFSIEDIGIPKMFAEIFATIFDLMVREKGARNFIDIFKDIIGIKVTDSKTRGHLAQLIKRLEIRSSNVLVGMIKELAQDLEKILLGSNKILLSPEERVNNILILFGMCADYGNGHLIIDHNNYLSLKDDYDLNQEVYNLMILAMQQFFEEIGKDGKDNLMIPLVGKGNNKTTISAHPLGGCIMGNDASNGVVDSMGRVFKGSNGNEIYDELYVVDGSIIPTSLGVNASLTIAALSFRIALNIIGDKHFLPN